MALCCIVKGRENERRRGMEEEKKGMVFFFSLVSAFVPGCEWKVT